MHTPIELGRAWFLKGIAAFEQDDFEAASAAFEQALIHVPGRPSVLLNLGVTRVHLQRFAEAIEPLQQALAADPQAADAWIALGTALDEVGRRDEALAALDHARTLADMPPLLSLRRARILARLGRWPQAQAAYREVLSAQPDHADAWMELGELYRETGSWDQAADAYRAGQRHGADPAWAHYLLAAVTGQGSAAHPPGAYVQGLFDGYADDFDDHLVGTLAYQGHRTLVEQLDEPMVASLGHVLDMGCGTGLCGPLVRERCTRLTGIDLSPQMIDKARARGVYDVLEVADLCAWLGRTDERFDTALAADVLIYVGELGPLFEALSPRMSAGGCFAFTVEAGAPGTGARLLPSLRYSHAPDYVEALARRWGFELVRRHTAPIRHDQREAILADYVTLRRLGPGV